MEGHIVERKAGWDTHGLPVGIEVQKQLDLMSNEAIELLEWKRSTRNAKKVFGLMNRHGER